MIGDISHICNRGFKKHIIFSDEKDYLRFVLNLYRLNNKDGSLRIAKNKHPFSDLPKQNKLVEILKWTLLPNHYHLLLYEKTEGGIVEFVKRLGNAYTKYLNIKHSSGGYVFQNSAKIIPIDEDAQYTYIPFYIDLNPVDFLSVKSGDTNKQKVLDSLSKYSWSSYRDYFGNFSQFLPIINKELFYELFDHDPKSYQKEILNLLKKDGFDELTKHVNLPGWHTD